MAAVDEVSQKEELGDLVRALPRGQAKLAAAALLTPSPRAGLLLAPSSMTELKAGEGAELANAALGPSNSSRLSMFRDIWPGW